MGMEQAQRVFTTHEIMGNHFEVPSEYSSLNPIGLGGFGIVCSARTAKTGTAVAIKKILKPFQTAVHCKRAYRELMLLKHMEHDNVIGLLDVFVSPSQDLYIVTELLGADLHQVIVSQPLDISHIQYFLYQMLRGVKYVHSANVIHRDLKPSNILVNENCDLKICDFGLARISDIEMTGYVSTRYYRAPEIMLTWQHYDKAVDIWSIGCIFAEMLIGKPLFPGKDHINQFSLICDLLGTPSDQLMKTICSENTLKYVQSLPRRQKVPFNVKFPNVDPVALDLLEKMLCFDPQSRITAIDALAHSFLESFHDPDDEPLAPKHFDWSFSEKDLPVEEWRDMISREISNFVVTFEDSKMSL